MDLQVKEGSKVLVASVNKMGQIMKIIEPGQKDSISDTYVTYMVEFENGQVITTDHTGVSIITEVSDAEEIRYLALRNHLMINIQLADNKLHSLVQLGMRSSNYITLYLDGISPRIDTPSAPIDYNLFGVNNIDGLKYECDVLKKILEEKLSIVNEMITYLRD